MSPPIFTKMINSRYDAGKAVGAGEKHKEVICWLRASGMTAEEISVVLCIKPDVVVDAVQFKDQLIDTYAHQLKVRRKSCGRRENNECQLFQKV